MKDLNIKKLLYFAIASVLFSVIITLFFLIASPLLKSWLILLIIAISITLAYTVLLYFVFFSYNRKVFEEIQGKLENFIKGDLREIAKDTSGAQYLMLFKSMDNFIAKFSEDMKKIELSVLDINGNASTLLSFSENIQQRINSEKENVQKINESMTELKNITNFIKSYATDALFIAKANNEKIMQSAQAIKKLIEAMNDISTASASIVEITNFIAEIADETNLLALNASIEASRAKKEGAGFSIVASEIRDLSEKSSSAIKNIASTVENIMKNVARGVMHSNEANNALNSILQGTSEISNKTEEIDSRISTQNEVTTSVYNDIEEVNKLVNLNSELLFEMLGAVHNLTKQSEILKDITAKFIKGDVDLNGSIFGVGDNILDDESGKISLDTDEKNNLNAIEGI